MSPTVVAFPAFVDRHLADMPAGIDLRREQVRELEELGQLK
jgi:hypothetical protein